MNVWKFLGLFLLSFTVISAVNNHYALDRKIDPNTVQYQSSLIQGQKNLHKNHPSLTPLREIQLHRLQIQTRRH
jgi:hypothetical protein